MIIAAMICSSGSWGYWSGVFARYEKTSGGAGYDPG